MPSSPRPSTPPGSRRLPLLSVLTAGVLGEFAFALLLLPLLQHYLVFDRHLSVGLPGYILAAYGLSRLLAQLPLGGLAAAIDGRLATGAGYLAVLLAGLVFWAPAPPLALVLAAAVFGLGHALADPLLPAALAAGVESSGRGRVLAALNLAQVAGLVAGLVGGAFIADLAPAAAGFLLAAAANAATLLLLTFGAGALVRGRPALEGSAGAQLWRGLVSERFVYLLGVLFVLALAANLLMPDLSLFSVRRLHVSLHILTLYLVPAAVAGIVALPVGGWLADHYGRLPPLLGGAGVGALALAVFTRIHDPWQAAVAAVFAAAGLALTMPASSAALVDVSNTHNRALLLGGMMAVQGLAEAVGPLASGFLTQIGGSALPFAAASVALWLAVPGSVLFASTPHDGEPGQVVPYTPLTRFISRAHIRAHVWLQERQSEGLEER